MCLVACSAPAQGPTEVVLAPTAAASSTTAAQPACGSPRAWSLLVDASPSMTARFLETQRFGHALVDAVGEEGVIQLRVFDGATVISTSKWLVGGSPEAHAVLDAAAPAAAVAGASSSRDKPLAAAVEAALAPDADLVTLPQALRRRALVVLTDGNGALGTENDARALGARASKAGEVVVVLWLPRPMTEELYEHARSFARSMASARGMFVEAPEALSPEKAAELAKKIAAADPCTEAE
jgi:hypothetical protein